jgi:hypothetical protein
MTWPARVFMSSTRIRSGGRRLAWLCVLLCLTASAEFGSDLPIGYQEITDLGDGNYRVVARCVETRALLETLAAKTGKPIVFDQPCNTYVSILHPDKIAPPEKWLDYVAGLGAMLNCTLKEDGAWHVYALSLNPLYEPALTEQEILDKYRLAVSPASSASSGIDKGLVFCRGALIPPPYDVTWQITGDGRAEIAINGVTVRQVIQRSAISAVREVPDLPASGQFERYGGLDEYVAYRLYPTLLTNMSPHEAREATIRFLETQHIVEAVLQDAGIYPNIGVRFTGQTWRSDIFPVNYDYEVGDAWDAEADAGKPVDEDAARSATEIESWLSQDRIVVYSKSGVILLHPDLSAQLANSLKLARDLSPVQAECVLAEVLEDRGLARELAANLPESYDRAIDLLEAVRRRNSQPAPATEGDDIKRAVDSLVR